MFVPLSPLNVLTLTSPLVLKLLNSQGYLWLPYDLAEVIKLIGETFEPPFVFQKNTLSFLRNLESGDLREKRTPKNHMQVIALHYIIL